MVLRNAFMLLVALVAAAGCADYDIPATALPELVARQPSGVTCRQATLHGSVVGGPLPYGDMYFSYTTAAGAERRTPALAPSGGEVEYTVDGLDWGTGYTCRLLYDNAGVRLASNAVGFSTLPASAPQVGALGLVAKGQEKIVCRIRIADAGGLPLTCAGIRMKALVNGREEEVRVPLGGGSEPLEADVEKSGLRHGWTYDIVPFAANEGGEAVGDTLRVVMDNDLLSPQEGMLHELFDSQPYAFQYLTVEGRVNSRDFSAIRQRGVFRLNLYKTTVVGDVAADDDVLKAGDLGSLPLCATLVLPYSVKVVERNALARCGALSELWLPDEALAIVASAECGSLERIVWHGKSSEFVLDDGVLLSGDRTRVVWYPAKRGTAYDMPSTVKAVGANAFWGARLRSVCLDGVGEIGQGAFAESELEDVSLSDAVEAVADSVFFRCSRLQTVRLGEGVREIGSRAFAQTASLKELRLRSKQPPRCAPDAFEMAGGNGGTAAMVLVVPAGTAHLYMNQLPWSRFGTIVTE